MDKISLDFPRQIGKKRTTCHSQRQMNSYLKKLSDKSSCYTSLYGFKRLYDDGKPDYSTAIIDRGWWDFDLGKNGVSIEGVKDEVHILCTRILNDHPTSDIRVVATGRGFHVHQMFPKEQNVSGVAWSSELQRYEADMGAGLKSLDGIGYSEKLTRIPGTYNPSRKRWAVVIDLQTFLDSPHDYIIPKSPSTMPKDKCPFFGLPVPATAFSLVDWVQANPKKKTASKAILRTSDAAGIGAAGDVPLPPCINSLVKQPNPEHKARIFLVSELAYNMRWFAEPSSLSSDEKKVIEDEICAYIEGLNWLDYNPHITRKGVRSCMNYSNPPSCRSIQRRGWCHSPCWRDDGSLE